MTDVPYTEDDLIAEAARQHRTLTEDPDFMGVGEMMDGEEIESTKPAPERAEAEYPTIGERGPYWEEALDEEQYDAVQRKIHRLIVDAADTSAWAIRCGADGYEPLPTVANISVEGRPLARLHFAFPPNVAESARKDLMVALAEAAASLNLRIDKSA